MKTQNSLQSTQLFVMLISTKDSMQSEIIADCPLRPLEVDMVIFFGGMMFAVLVIRWILSSLSRPRS